MWSKKNLNIRKKQIKQNVQIKTSSFQASINFIITCFQTFKKLFLKTTINCIFK